MRVGNEKKCKDQSLEQGSFKKLGEGREVMQQRRKLRVKYLNARLEALGFQPQVRRIGPGSWEETYCS